MKIGIVTREKDVTSFLLYRGHITSKLKDLGVEFINFSPEGSLPTGCDLIWDPGMGLKPVPEILLEADAPVIVTIHGMRIFSVPLWELADSFTEFWMMRKYKINVRKNWKWFRKKVVGVIAVSEFSKSEIIKATSVSENIVHPIYYGVEYEKFKPDGPTKKRGKPYFFHVSAYQPKKNLHRIIKAYSKLPKKTRPDFVVVAPGFPKDIKMSGLTLMKEKIPNAELPEWYRGALAFVSPSLHETFGMVFMEAMACGCPVITANITACPETAGGAAIVVNPRSTTEIKNGMQKIMDDNDFRESLRQKGIARSQEFRWEKCAQNHFNLFNKIIKNEAA